jgi:hypothetical protein
MKKLYEFTIIYSLIFCLSLKKISLMTGKRQLEYPTPVQMSTETGNKQFCLDSLFFILDCIIQLRIINMNKNEIDLKKKKINFSFIETF